VHVPPPVVGVNFFLRRIDLYLLLLAMSYDTLMKFWYHDYSLTTVGLLVSNRQTRTTATELSAVAEQTLIFGIYIK